MHRSRRAHKGFTYLGLLVAIAVMSVGLLAVSEVWVTSVHRQRMAQVEWVGEQFVQAIGSYYEGSPGSVKAYPQGLHDLIEDKRYITMRRHLRTLYVNPFSGLADWELVQGPGGGVRGVRAVVEGPSGRQALEYVYRPLLKPGTP